MPRVWYVGPYPYREITTADWDRVGQFGPHFQWSADNGWSIDQTQFTQGQLRYLDEDPEFLSGQEGLRPDTPAPEDSVIRPYKVDATILKLVQDAFKALALTETALTNIDQSKASAAQSATNAGTAQEKAEQARDIALAAKVEWKGAWAAGTSYITRDVVSFGGSSWIALAASKGVTPVAGASWAMLSAKGDQGVGSYPGMLITDAMEGTKDVLSVISSVALVAAIQHHLTGSRTTPSTAVGKALMAASDAKVARTAIGAEQSGITLTTEQYNALATKDANRNYYLSD